MSTTATDTRRPTAPPPPTIPIVDRDDTPVGTFH